MFSGYSGYRDYRDSGLHAASGAQSGEEQGPGYPMHFQFETAWRVYVDVFGNQQRLHAESGWKYRSGRLSRQMAGYDDAVLHAGRCIDGFMQFRENRRQCEDSPQDFFLSLRRIFLRCEQKEQSLRDQCPYRRTFSHTVGEDQDSGGEGDDLRHRPGRCGI